QATNLELTYLVQGLNEVMAYGIPTFYGVDLSPYLQLAPWPALPAQSKNILPIALQAGDPENELGRLQSADLRQLVSFQFNDGKQPVGTVKSFSYKVTLDRSVEFMTGTLTVQTTDQIGMKKVSTPQGQPHSPYTFGRKYAALTPTQISVNLNLQRQGSRLADVRMTLSKGTVPNTGNLLPEISLSGSITSKVDFTLAGKVASGGLAMAGDIGIVDAKGNRQNLQVQSIRVDSRSLRLSADGLEQKYRVEIVLEEGKLSGDITSTNPDLERILATISMAGDKPQIKFIDKSKPEPWR
ncbi:MAG: hypothetical protein FJZ00_03870, partial [Candidatus Sericytochromatia bacterium]|nr:hypothetical protein [Candidatus Tanganyikabacteria bacterium]